MENKIRMGLAVLTAILIVICGIIFKQDFIKMLPFLISTFIVLFQSKVNRYSYIAGAANAALYALVYYLLGAYSMMAYALLFSLPIQLLTFFNWQKHAYEKSVTLKKMSGKLRIMTLVAFAALWLAVFGVLKLLKSDVAISDTSASLLGILVSVLTALAYIEYSYLWIISSFASLVLNLQLALNDISNISLVVSSVFNLYCVIMAVVTVRKLYKKQQEEGITK